MKCITDEILQNLGKELTLMHRGMHTCSKRFLECNSVNEFRLFVHRQCAKCRAACSLDFSISISGSMGRNTPMASSFLTGGGFTVCHTEGFICTCANHKLT